MKKCLGILTMLIFLSGCSLIEDFTNSVDYVSEATEYIEEASTFAEDIPALAEQAVNDPAALTELQTELQSFQEKIQVFNDLTVPDFAADIHQQIEGYNEQMQTGIETALEKIEAGEFTPEFLQNSEILKAVEEVMDLRQQLQQLGN